MQNTMDQMDDKAKATDLLTAEKFMTHVYNTYLCETVTPEVRSCLSSLLADEHKMQEQVFSEMLSRNWYTVPKAQDVKVDTEKQKYRADVTV